MAFGGSDVVSASRDPEFPPFAPFRGKERSNMKRRVARIGRLVILMLLVGLSAAVASAQDAAERHRGCGGPSRGRQAFSSITPVPSSPSPSDLRPPAVSRFSSARSGPAPTTRSRSTPMDMQVSAAAWSNSSVRSCVTRSSRTSVSRLTWWAASAAVSNGRTSTRSSRTAVDRNIFVIYYGAGARIPIHRRLDAFADWRLIITGDEAAEMAVLGPLRAGIAFRF